MKRFIIFIFIFTVLLTVLPAVQAVDNSPSLTGLQILPKDHIWNVPVNTLPVDARSSDYISTIGPNSFIGGYLGLPYNVVDSSVPHVMVTSWGAGAWAADKVPAPFPENAMVETLSSDRHLIIVDRDEKAVYEFYQAVKAADGTWRCNAQVRWSLSDYRLLPDGYGSADAAGMAMLPGLLRYDEVNSGTITHALRLVIPDTQNAHVWPATHHNGITDPRYPPMGQRFRLKASFDTSGYSPQMKTILEALKTYGVMIADNGAGQGGEVDLSVVPDSRWSYNTLLPLHQVKISDFEAVDVTSLMVSRNSGQARINRPITGDWNGDGTGDIGIVSGSSFSLYFENEITSSTIWGKSTDVPVTGDWNGDGVTDVGVYRPSVHTFYLKNGNALSWTTTTIVVD
jgi:hypothetical protein